jgi:uncharacterized membrane protein
MNFPHLHLLLNHFPIIGTIIALGIFLASFVGKNRDLRRASLIVFAAMALLTLPAFFSGVGARAMILGQPGVSDALIQRHEGAAMLALWFMVITGALALVGLWQSHQNSRPASWNILAILLFSLLTVGLMARTGNTGGDIRHPEVRDYQGTKVTEGILGGMIHAFEPTPGKFTQLMVSSKWWWAFMMDLHFIGLALLIGTIGILDIRIMGFLKHLPVAPLHRFLPCSMAGLGINILTGLLAFIGMPGYYTFDVAFWVKIGTLMLLGLNVAAFYLTSVFGRVEHLGPGEDAPMSAKLVAASSLFLWFAVITFRRYIQLYIDTISSSPS